MNKKKSSRPQQGSIPRQTKVLSSALSNSKSVSKKTVPPKKAPVVTTEPRVHGHNHFIAVMILFVGFSLYAISSFVNSNNSYIDNVYTSVSGAVVVPKPYTGPLPPPELAKKNPFIDLNINDKYATAIIDLYYKGILKGYEDGTFRPSKAVNRAEFLKMVVEAKGLNFAEFPASSLKLCFNDIKNNKDGSELWYTVFVCAAKYKGWVGGYADGSFHPNDNIMNSEASKIVLNAFLINIPKSEEVKVMPYADVKPTDWYVGVAAAAKAAGIIEDDGWFDPTWSITRAEVAGMIYNAIKTRELDATHL